MKFNYKLSRLCGTSYGSSDGRESFSNIFNPNVVFHPDGNSLYSPVGNRVQHFDLIHNSMHTLPFQSRSNVSRIAVHPQGGKMLVVVDKDGYSLLVNVVSAKHVCVVLHRFKFRKPVHSMQFSPNQGTFLAVGMDRLVEIWYTPSRRKEFAPFILHKSLLGLSKPVMHLEWSQDASVLMGTSEDLTVKVWTTFNHKGYIPATLAGHRQAVVAAFFKYDAHKRISGVHTVDQGGSVFTFQVNYKSHKGTMKDESLENTMDHAVGFFSGDATAAARPETETSKSQAEHLIRQEWKMKKRHFIEIADAKFAKVISAAMQNSMLVIGWSSGMFGLYEMPDCTNIHTLSIGNGAVSTIALNNTAEWIALGCVKHNQLLVWEWRSETYVIKQSSHGERSAMTCMAYSPDSSVIATGGYDAKLKLWNTISGFCFVTFGNEHHKGPITGIVFANPTVVVSSSLDGTVRAFDLIRYRNFKTMTAPARRIQFNCVAVDPSGEIVAAGTALGNYDIYLWNLQTGQVLDVLSGHAGPVSSVKFNPIQGSLVSTSWDGTAKVWEVFKKDSGDAESFQHNHDVVCCDIRPDGKVLCTGTLGGSLYFWRISDGTLMHIIDGQMDISGGRKVNDRMTWKNNAASRYFTSVCFTADGQCVLAGGNSKYICIYEVSQQILLKKFQITYNRSLDGVLDELNSKNLADGGPVDPFLDGGEEHDLNPSSSKSMVLPGARRVDDGLRKHKVEVLTTNVAFSPTGRDWAAVTGEGLFIFSLDDDMIFDPIALMEAITPAAVHFKLQKKEFGPALIMSMHLNESELVYQVLDETPYTSIPHVVQAVTPAHLERLMQFLTVALSESPHIEFYVEWCLQVLQIHGLKLQKNRPRYMRAFRAMFKVLQTKYEDCKLVCDSNRYALDFVVDQGQLIAEDNSAF